MIIALALSASLDVTYEVDELRVGDITRPFAITRVAGGKALNAARAASASGAAVRAVAALGGPTGEWVASMLATDGIAADLVPLRAVTRTCIAVVERAGSATSTDLYEPATRLDSQEWRAYAATVRRVVSATTPEHPSPWAVLSGSLPPGVPPRELAALLSELRATGARVAADCSGDGLRAAAPEASLIKVNRREASELLGEELATAADACARLRQRYGADVVVTDGIAGAAALLGDAAAVVPPPARRGRFPAGSGDAFLGGLLAAFERGASADDALAAAASAGERNAMVPGQGVLAAEA
ncbi:MAG TPA: PfkB family carbohydrate kinase [Lacisediminihabitans sp.]|uniref:1-phosphofructokinase family hexose kinase n=1 Tax=Lacisediminihabitans sp. TaxID=2787631 RepID=UPI002EDA183F